MGMKLESVKVRFDVAGQAHVSFVVVPTGTDTNPSGSAQIPEESLDALKSAAYRIQQAIDRAR